MSASDIGADGPRTKSGIATTKADGKFELNQTNNGADRFIRVEARLVGDDLEVNDSKLDDLASLDLLDENWRTVWKSKGQVSGPGVPTGSRIFGGSTSFDLGDETYRRQALIWYARATLDRFVQEDPWFVLKGKYTAIYQRTRSVAPRTPTGSPACPTWTSGARGSTGSPRRCSTSSCTCGTTTTTPGPSTGSVRLRCAATIRWT